MPKEVYYSRVYTDRPPYVENVLALAERADKMVNALNKIMAAAIKITTERDWCLIGGAPYLQESGAVKVML